MSAATELIDGYMYYSHIKSNNNVMFGGIVICNTLFEFIFKICSSYWGTNRYHQSNQ